MAEFGVRSQFPVRRRGAHYVPKPQYRSEDASKHTDSFMQAVSGWYAEALAGQRRERLTAPSSKSIGRSHDDIRCDCAYALANAVEWDGALLAHYLALRGWPLDVDLVRACHVWSCGVLDRVMTFRRHSAGSLNPARR
jgi:hypothetical protein